PRSGAKVAASPSGCWRCGGRRSPKGAAVYEPLEEPPYQSTRRRVARRWREGGQEEASSALPIRDGSRVGWSNDLRRVVQHGALVPRRLEGLAHPPLATPTTNRPPRARRERIRQDEA